jgi:hypothetical protein
MIDCFGPIEAVEGAEQPQWPAVWKLCRRGRIACQMNVDAVTATMANATVSCQPMGLKIPTFLQIARDFPLTQLFYSGFRAIFLNRNLNLTLDPAPPLCRLPTILHSAPLTWMALNPQLSTICTHRRATAAINAKSQSQIEWVNLTRRFCDGLLIPSAHSTIWVAVLGIQAT